MPDRTEPFRTDRGLIAGYGCSELGPYLVLDELAGESWSRYRLVVRERSFTLESSQERYCTGRHDLAAGQSSPCPLRAALADRNLEQCSACFAATGFNPAFYNAAQLSPQQQRRNRQPHSVYLAAFGGNLLKVGMTHAARGLGRLLEQGARLGAVIATLDDADRARELEAYIASSFEVAESIRSARKRQLLGSPFSASSARLDLARKIESIAELRAGVAPRPEILELDRYYAGARRLDGSITDLSEVEPLAISGHCIAMVGDILVVEQGKQRFMLSMGQMLGRRVRVETSQRPNHFTGQLGLPF